MPAKTCLQIKPLYYFSSQMSVILILSIGSLKSFYCCFRAFFFSFPGLLDMHGGWRLDESFGSGSALWHWSHVPPCKCPLSGWALLPGSLNPGQHISHSSCLAYPPSFATFWTPASPFQHSLFHLCLLPPFPPQTLCRTSAMFHKSVAHFDIQFFKIIPLSRPPFLFLSLSRTVP